MPPVGQYTLTRDVHAQTGLYTNQNMDFYVPQLFESRCPLGWVMGSESRLEMLIRYLNHPTPTMTAMSLRWQSDVVRGFQVWVWCPQTDKFAATSSLTSGSRKSGPDRLRNESLAAQTYRCTVFPVQ